MKRGDIVLAHFPHASGTPAKRRPSLVVQADIYNQRLSNVILASIASNLSRRADPAHYLIDVATVEGKLSGLRHSSLVSCLNLAVLPMPLAGVKIGELSPAAMLQIDACLKAALGIS